MARQKTHEVLAHNVKTLREVRKMSQLDLAKAVAVSRRTVARLEAGDVEDPGVDQVRRIAEALRVTVALLIDAPLQIVTIAVPSEARDALEGAESCAMLERVVRVLKS